jgi:hypothetical protein
MQHLTIRNGFGQKVDTPKALANSSPGLELATTLGNEYQKLLKTLKVLGLCSANPLQGLKNKGPRLTQG